MRKTTIISAILMISQLASAKKEHRHHEAHVHGAATLSIAFDQLKGKIELKAASESILGFEHVPKKKKDLKTFSEAKTQFEDNISQMIKFSPEADCSFNNTKIEMQNEKNSKHSNFVAEFEVVCKTSIKNTSVLFDFTFFKRLKDLDVTVLVDDLQKTAEIKRKPVALELK